MTHSPFPAGDYKQMRTFVGNNSSYVLPPPSSTDNIFQLDLLCCRCADVILIPEGLGPTPNSLRFVNVIVPESFFFDSSGGLPSLKNIAIGSFLDIPSYLLYDFPLVEDAWWVTVPLDVC